MRERNERFGRLKEMRNGGAKAIDNRSCDSVSDLHFKVEGGNSRRPPENEIEDARRQMRESN